MNRTRMFTRQAAVILAAFTFTCSVGFETSKQHVHSAPPFASQPAGPAPQPVSAEARSTIRLALRRQHDETDLQLPPPEIRGSETLAAPLPQLTETLVDLEAWAMANNPTLRRMQQEAAAEWAKTGYVSRLPDPTVSSIFFAPPMNFEPDRQVAEIQVMQMIPWLGRLKAEAQRAHMEALVAETQYQAERLRVISEIRVNWFQLYVLGKQIETITADQVQLESLITTANARVRTGDAQPGDVLMATLELSSLQEQLFTNRQQVAATSAELNRLVGARPTCSSCRQ